MRDAMLAACLFATACSSAPQRKDDATSPELATGFEDTRFGMPRPEVVARYPEASAAGPTLMLVRDYRGRPASVWFMFEADHLTRVSVVLRAAYAGMAECDPDWKVLRAEL